jgi:tRNA modification GTPase
MLQVIQLTPPGRGAIATLRIEGPGAAEAVQSHFRAESGRPLTAYPPDQIAVGRFGGPSGEEVVVRRHGKNAVDLHCHGGLAAVAMIEETLATAGCRRVAWRDWVSSRHDDPIAAAALAALAEARTERTAVILLDQYQGALRRAMDGIRQTIGRGDAAAARQRIDALLSRVDLGRHLVRPWSVVLGGRANVGKSSLINALAGQQRSIVHHAPGTTRDAVTLSTAIDGWPVELCDTAGLRQAGDALESAGVERAQQRLAGADLVLLVCDQSVPWSAEDQTLLDQWPEAVLVHNKCDLPAGQPDNSVPLLGTSSAASPTDVKHCLFQAVAHDLWRPAGLDTSALRGDGIEALLATIGRRLVPDPPFPGAAVPFTAQQVAAIQALSEPAW